MRNLIDVLNKIIAIAPEFEDKFKSVKESIGYTAPEAMGDRWMQAMLVLQAHATDHPKEAEILQIWMDK